jgi:type II secretory ATPase GspE/PulE/Tfp pilus assembly ATPase PilB-like protein
MSKLNQWLMGLKSSKTPPPNEAAKTTPPPVITVTHKADPKDAKISKEIKDNKAMTAASVTPTMTTRETGPAEKKSDAPAQRPADNIKIEDERSLAMAGSSLAFSGEVLTAEGGPIRIPEESRNLCALFDTGLWVVSASHRRSPLVTSVALMAKRQGYRVDEPRYVTPNIITQAYLYADRKSLSSQFDENSVRRRIVHTLEQAVAMQANDIHIEAVNNRTRVEFRIDGALRVWETWTQREGEQFLAAVYSHSVG